MGEHSHGEPTRLIDELGLCGAVRVDVAVVNGSLSGFELKSDRDTLRRLPTQVEYYSRVLDHASLVIGEGLRSRHADGELVPEWWGVVVATQSEAGDVLLEEVRPPELNQAVDPEGLVQLLWRDEALDELSVRGLDPGVRNKPRAAVWARLASSVSIDELRALVRARLKAREGWRQPAPRA